MRKNLRPKFWSQGTPLGSLGALSLKAHRFRFSQYGFPITHIVYRLPRVVTWLEDFFLVVVNSRPLCTTQKEEVFKRASLKNR